MTPSLSAPTRPCPIAPDARVLANSDLRDDVDIATTSRFDDDVWDLSPMNHQAHQRVIRLNFPTIPAAFRAVAKELCYALLACELPEGETRLRLASVRSAFTELKKFLDWAHKRRHRSLAAMTPDHLAQYQRWLLTRSGLSPSTRGTHRRTTRMFWLYRELLYSDALTFDPQRVPSWSDDNCQPPDRTENSTARIPEEVISPLLVWALRWVNDFSADILAARAEWFDAYIAGHDDSKDLRRGHKLDAKLAALEELLEQYRQAKSPLPGSTSGTVNASFLARQLRMERSFLARPRGQAMIDAAAAELGIADTTNLFTPVTHLIDGEPWLPSFDFNGFRSIMRHLQTACYIVIAYQSGMRDSEIKHLEAGCISRKRDREGLVYRRQITSLTFKGEATPRGVTATWVISEAVEKAVAVMEQLQGTDEKYLFVATAGYRRQRSSGRAMVCSRTNENLDDFVDWVNQYCVANGRHDDIPLVRKQRWLLKTSQFRRTLAWFIARRSGGTIAGTIQYRHYSIQMFEGYAGTADSGFRAEVEAEQTLQRGEILLAMIEGHQHHQLLGPAAGEARSRLATLERAVAYAGSVVNDPKRLKKIMVRQDPHIYLGKFVTCVYDANKALCRRRVSVDDAQLLPDLASCEPLSCRNVTLSPENVKALNEQRESLRRHLDNADILAPYVSHRLHRQHRDLSDFLDSVAGTTEIS